MVKKNAVVITSVVIASTIVTTTYVLSGNMSIGVDESGNSMQQSTATSIPSNLTVVKIFANAGNNSFSPNPVEVKVGEPVTWINDDSGRHSVTSKVGVFESGIMGKGQSFSFTFDKAGEYSYSYFCGPHPNMVGTVVVTES